MLRITIDLIPRGDVKRRRTLHVIDIANDATGTAGCGNYVAKLSKRGCRGDWRFVRVLGFPRKWLTAYDLVYQVLAAVVGDRAPKRMEWEVIKPARKTAPKGE